MPDKPGKAIATLVGFILLLACCLVGSVVSAAPAAPVSLRIGYQPISSPTGAVFEAMKRDRLLHNELRRYSKTISFIPYKKGVDSIAAFNRGELDAIAMGDLPMIEFALTTPVVVIGQLRHGFSTVVAQRGTTVKGLKGKRIGNAFATSGHYALLKTLQNGGLAESDVKLVPLDVNEMPDALLNGKIDAFSVWEPVPSIFIAQYPNRFSSVGRQMGAGFLLVSKKYTSTHKDNSVQLLAAGLARAMQWLSKDASNIRQAAAWNQSSIWELSCRKLPASADALSRQIASDLQLIQYSPRLPSSKGKVISMLADEFRFLKEIGKLPQSASWETVSNSFDHSLMERIYKNPQAYMINRFDYELR